VIGIRIRELTAASGSKTALGGGFIVTPPTEDGAHARDYFLLHGSTGDATMSEYGNMMI